MLVLHIIVCLRALCFTLAVVIVPMSARGFLAYSRRGGQTLSNAVRSMAFLIALSIGSFNAGYLFDRQPVTPPGPRVLFSMTLLVVTLLVSLFTLFRLRNRSVTELARIEDHIDVATAIAELDMLSPREAQDIALDCRRRVVMHLASKGRKSD